MNSWLDSRFIAQAVIVVSACLGGWMIFVEPRVLELEQIETQIAETLAAAPAPDERTVQLVAEHAARIRNRTQAILEASRASQDSAGQYRQIMSLASQHGVIVEGLNPGMPGTAKGHSVTNVIPIEMSLVAEYHQVATFLESLTALRGYVRPSAITVSPVQRNGEDLVQAHIVCEALSFALPETLTDSPGGLHDQH